MFQQAGCIPFETISAKKGKGIKLAMQRLFLTGKIVPVGARLLVEHTFVSDEKSPLEVIYTFGLPREATLRKFWIKGENFSVESELKRREEVIELYEKALEEGSLAAMAQRYRDGIINLTIGNIRPKEKVRILLEILAGVEVRDDGFRFRFPFTLPPCYHSEARAVAIDQETGEMELPDDKFGDVILPVWRSDTHNLHQVGFNLEVEIPCTVKEICSPSHALRAKFMENGRYVISLAAEKDLPDRDLILQIKNQGYELLTSAESKADGRLSFYGLVPSEKIKEGNGGKQNVAWDPGRDESKNKDRGTGASGIVFLLDRSGSMSGTRIEQAKRALKVCLKALEDGDAFSIVAFDDIQETFSDTLVRWSENEVERALRFVDGIQARGGTEMLMGLEKAANILNKSGLNRSSILIITDGEVFGTEEIIKRIASYQVKVHCLGIGSAGQDRFMSNLTSATGGSCVYLTPTERIEDETMRLLNAIKLATFKVLGCRLEGFGQFIIEPEVKQTVYEGRPVVLFGQVNNPGAGRLVLQVARDDQETEVEFPLNLSPKAEDDTIWLLQGARLIDRLEAFSEQVADKKDEIMRQLENLSKKYGLASKAMGLFAVVKRFDDTKGELPRTTIVPVGIPEDLEFPAYFRICRTMVDVNMVDEKKKLIEPCACSEPPRFRIRQIAKDQEFASDLFDLASSLNADGSMPGKSEEEKIKCSIIALLKFIQYGGYDNSNPFILHIQKLMRFLSPYRNKYEIIKELMDLIISESLDIFDVGQLEKSSNFWQELERMIRKVGA